MSNADAGADRVILRVTRGDPASGAYEQTFSIRYEEGMTLLDALTRIRDDVDPSLAVRWSCRANACKECSASMNGKIGFLCTTRATPNVETEIRPLPKPRWIRDLVTELS